MPKPPSYLDQVNYIVEFVQNPCDAPWTVYLETALVPTGNLILALLSFGMDDIIRGYFRPKGLRTRRHGRRGPRGGRPGRGRGGIPEIGEMIGKRLPGAEELSQRKVTDGVRHLWLIDGVIQRGLWHWMVFDLTLEFGYSWGTLLDSTEFCKYSRRGRALREPNGGGALGIQGWKGVQAPTLIYEHGAIDCNSGQAFISSGNWLVVFSLEWTNVGTITNSTSIGIFADPSGDLPIAVSEGHSVKPGAQGQAIVTAHIRGPRFLFLLQKVDVDAIQNTGGQQMYQEMVDPPDLPA